MWLTYMQLIQFQGDFYSTHGGNWVNINHTSYILYIKVYEWNPIKIFNSPQKSILLTHVFRFNDPPLHLSFMNGTYFSFSLPMLLLLYFITFICLCGSSVMLRGSVANLYHSLFTLCWHCCCYKRIYLFLFFALKWNYSGHKKKKEKAGNDCWLCWCNVVSFYFHYNKIVVAVDRKRNSFEKKTFYMKGKNFEGKMRDDNMNKNNKREDKDQIS